MCVIGRSAVSLSGMSVSSSSSGTRPTCASHTAHQTVRPGMSTPIVSGLPSLPDDPRQRQPLGVVVGVGVLLVAVGVDRLSEVAVAIEQADADERDGHVRRGLEMVAGEHAEAARVDTERLVEAVLGAEVGNRAGESRAVLALEPVTAPFSMYWSNSSSSVRYSAIRSTSSSTGDQSRCSLRTGTGLRWRSQAWTSMRRNSTRTRGCHIQ